MPVFLGLDLGEKRVGVAQSDETGTIAEAVTTLVYKGKEDLLKQLRESLERIRPEKIVVGLPKTLRDEMGPAAKKVVDWVEWFKSRLAGEWVL